MAALGVGWRLAEPGLLGVAMARSSLARNVSPIVYRAFEVLRPDIRVAPGTAWPWAVDAPVPQFWWSLPPREGRPKTATGVAWTAVDLRGPLFTIENCTTFHSPDLGPADLAGRGGCEMVLRRTDTANTVRFVVLRINQQEITALAAIWTTELASVRDLRDGPGDRGRIALLRNWNSATATPLKLVAILDWAADGALILSRDELPDGWKLWLPRANEVRRWPRDACVDQIFDEVTLPMAGEAASAPAGAATWLPAGAADGP
jgi:hypothetical protein